MKEYPNAIEHEKKLISALMLKGGAVIPEVADVITAEDFFRPEHRAIFRAIVAASNRGVPVDVLLVQDELKRMKAPVDTRYLMSLVDMEFTTARATAYAEIIKEKARLRQIIGISEVVMDEAGKDDADSATLKAKLESLLFRADDKETATFERVRDALLTAFNRITELSKNKELTGVATGLIDLDNVTNGLQKTDLIYLAARPSMGKTALALNIAYKAAKSGKSVALFSLEMSKMQLAMRTLSMLSNVESDKIRTGNLTKSEIGRVIDAMESASETPLFLDDTSGLSVAAIRAKAQRLKRDHGLDLIVIDYVQLMQGSRSKANDQNRVQEVSEISRTLKGLAKQLDVPVLALSQLSRAVEMRADKRPQLSDLRESGSLEQDADIVMFLYRDEYYNRDEGNENIAEVIIAKNRNGATGSVRLHFLKETQRFSNLIRESYDNESD